MSEYNWPKNYCWEEGKDYFVGPKKDLGAWMEVDMNDLKGSSSMKILDKEKAKDLVRNIVDEADMDIDKDNFHSFIGEIRKRSNNKLGGKTAKNILEDLFNNE